ncbi:MAG TPA: hypothetical protein VM243_05405 [Phycisphaerae bacterium]|nr:hypothetical protein [Phycisphaerae bacterium]
MTQLDPVAIYVLHQPSVIEADVLRAIAQEEGVRIKTRERAALIGGMAGALLVIGLFVHSVITGDIGRDPLARFAGLAYLCCIPFIIWYGIKRSRFGKVAAAMLKYSRCPHCGYDLRLLPTDAADGATVCPECGCAWRLGEDRAARTHETSAAQAAAEVETDHRRGGRTRRG